MPYTEATGNLFDLGLPAIGHGCNCAGVMGAGIAVEFRRRWPDMYTAYAQRCREHSFELGRIMVWPTADVVVYNLATQTKPGPTADLVAVTISVTRMLIDAEQRGLPRVGVPRIGAGYGGLEWSDVAAHLVAAAEQSPVELVVVSLPGVTSMGDQR